jgi:hypothetical protein
MMLVDSRGILLFLPLLLCSFLIFFSFSISYFGLLSLLTKLEAFRSIKAFKLAIFSMISLDRKRITARSEGRGSPLRKEEENKYQVCFRRPSEREHNSSELHQTLVHYFSPSLCPKMRTDSEDVLGLLSYLLQDVFMLLLQKVPHFFEPT